LEGYFGIRTLNSKCSLAVSQNASAAKS